MVVCRLQADCQIKVPEFLWLFISSMFSWEVYKEIERLGPSHHVNCNCQLFKKIGVISSKSMWGWSSISGVNSYRSWCHKVNTNAKGRENTVRKVKPFLLISSPKAFVFSWKIRQIASLWKTNSEWQTSGRITLCCYTAMTATELTPNTSQCKEVLM